MNILLTGASGFLGRHVVHALLQRGHTVRTLVRTPNGRLPNIEYFHADLAGSTDLVPALSNIDVIIHLAVQMSGPDQERIQNTLTATTRLLAAMTRSPTRRLVLASSLSVYDWTAARTTLNEETPLEQFPTTRDGYAIAKIEQERLAKAVAKSHNFILTILRPGYIWGAGLAFVPGVAAAAGPLQFIMSPSAALPLVYVENCAEAFAQAAESPRAFTANIIDDEKISAWRYVHAVRPRPISLPVPYACGLLAALAANTLTRPFNASKKLPSILQPRRFRARFRPLIFDNNHARATFSWRPRYAFAEAVARAQNGGRSP